MSEVTGNKNCFIERVSFTRTSVVPLIVSGSVYATKQEEKRRTCKGMLEAVASDVFRRRRRILLGPKN